MSTTDFRGAGFNRPQINRLKPNQSTSRQVQQNLYLDLAHHFSQSTSRTVHFISSCNCPEDPNLKIVWEAACDLQFEGLSHLRFSKLTTSGNTYWVYLDKIAKLPPTMRQKMSLII